MQNNEKAEGGAVKLPVADLRDWFAGQALIGLLSFSPDDGQQMSYGAAAQQAYLQADAMLKERGRSNG